MSTVSQNSVKEPHLTVDDVPLWNFKSKKDLPRASTFDWVITIYLPIASRGRVGRPYPGHLNVDGRDTTRLLNLAGKHATLPQAARIQHVVKRADPTIMKYAADVRDNYERTTQRCSASTGHENQVSHRANLSFVHHWQWSRKKKKCQQRTATRATGSATRAGLRESETSGGCLVVPARGVEGSHQSFFFFARLLFSSRTSPQRSPRRGNIRAREPHEKITLHNSKTSSATETSAPEICFCTERTRSKCSTREVDC